MSSETPTDVSYSTSTDTDSADGRSREEWEATVEALNEHEATRHAGIATDGASHPIGFEVFLGTDDTSTALLAPLCREFDLRLAGASVIDGEFVADYRFAENGGDGQ